MRWEAAGENYKYKGTAVIVKQICRWPFILLDKNINGGGAQWTAQIDTATFNFMQYVNEEGCLFVDDAANMQKFSNLRQNNVL